MKHFLYCSRVAPNDPQGRTCLQAGTLNDKTWNTLVKEIQDIRDDARAGKIPDTVA